MIRRTSDEVMVNLIAKAVVTVLVLVIVVVVVIVVGKM